MKSHKKYYIKVVVLVAVSNFIIDNFFSFQSVLMPKYSKDYIVNTPKDSICSIVKVNV